MEKWNLKNVQWDAYREELKEWDHETEEVDRAVISGKLHRDITEAAMKGIGKTKTIGTRRRKPWWSEEIKKERQKRKEKTNTENDSKESSKEV